jgi:hypothetical protein
MERTMRLRHDPVVYKNVLRAHQWAVTSPKVRTTDVMIKAHEYYNQNAPEHERLNMTQFNSAMITMHGINSRIKHGRKPKNGLYTWDQETRKMFPFKNRVNHMRKRHRMGSLAKREPEVNNGTPLLTRLARITEAKESARRGISIDVKLAGERGTITIEGPYEAVLDVMANLKVR